MNILSFIFKNKALILVGVLLSYIGYAEYQKRGLETVIANKNTEITTLQTEYASEQGRSSLYKNQIADVNEKLRSVTLLLSQSKVIITELENDRVELNRKLKGFEIDLVSAKEATEFINDTFQASLNCLETASGKGDILCGR